MLQSLVMAFAMYSKIPMPQIKWNKQKEDYSLVFFPLVGALIGVCQMLSYHLMNLLKMEETLSAAVLTALPILISGGIHMDGFLDTIDAKSAWKSKEERLSILKDPQAGAFAVIFGGVYLLLTFGLYTELPERWLPLLAVCYVYERTLSGLSLVLFPKARKEGMAAKAAEAAGRNVKWILGAEALLSMGVLCALQPLCGLLLVLAGMLCFLFYRRMAYRLFGGVTGDLAGYFLQSCELLLLLVTVLAGKFV